MVIKNLSQRQNTKGEQDQCTYLSRLLCPHRAVRQLKVVSGVLNHISVGVSGWGQPVSQPVSISAHFPVTGDWALAWQWSLLHYKGQTTSDGLAKHKDTQTIAFLCTCPAGFWLVHLSTLIIFSIRKRPLIWNPECAGVLHSHGIYCQLQWGVHTSSRLKWLFCYGWYFHTRRWIWDWRAGTHTETFRWMVYNSHTYKFMDY